MQVGLLVLALSIVACQREATPTAAPSASRPTLTSASCPGANAACGDGCGPGDGAMQRGSGAMMHGSMMGPGARSGPRPATAGEAVALPPLSVEVKSALLRALDNEYRSEALYTHIANKLGPKPPMAMIAGAEHRHAWVLESLALAHGVELPSNPWASAKQPELASYAAACRAGVESEKSTIAIYDEILKLDMPVDLRRAFTHLRAASAERHLPAFEACR